MSDTNYTYSLNEIRETAELAPVREGMAQSAAPVTSSPYMTGNMYAPPTAATQTAPMPLGQPMSAGHGQPMPLQILPAEIPVVPGMSPR